MNAIINIVAIGLSVLLLSVPLLNRHVFNTVNIDEIVIQGRERITKMQELQGDGNFQAAIDTGNAIVNDYRNDSLAIYGADVADWERLRAILKGQQSSIWAELFAGDIDEAEISVLQSTDPLPSSVKTAFIKALSFHVQNPAFFEKNQSKIKLQNHPDVLQRLELLKQNGLIQGGEGNYEVSDELSEQSRLSLIRFNVVLIEKVLLPELINKNPKRGNDWASEFIVQTALYQIGVCYQALYQLDDAVKVWDELIELFPKTIYAEVLFQQIGQSLYRDGKRLMTEGSVAGAETQFQKAIKYLEKIERNRDVAADFPKYKYADLKPNQYVNVDKASKAKSQVKKETAIYTNAQAEAEMSGQSDENQSGYFLEDAIRLIGECYIEMGKTDSARMQFSLLIDFFPESDNLDNSQKLISDSYIKDGDLTLMHGDSSNTSVRQKANEFYAMAVKSYLKFINVFPQSDLISETFIALGDAYNKMGKPQEAAAAFASALGRAKEVEDQAKVQLQIGKYFYDRKRYPDAIANFKVILNNFLSTEVAPNAQYMLGECFEAVGDTVEMVASYEVILDIYKRSSFLGGASYKLGTHYFNNGNYKEATRAFSTGVTYDPDGSLAPKSKFQIGMIWVRIAEEGQDSEKKTAYETAVKEFNKLIEQFGNVEESDQARYQIASCYQAMGDETKAKETAKEIINAEIQLKTFKLFGFGAETFEEEVTYWDDRLAETGDKEAQSEALYQKAQVLADKLNKYDEALSAYEQVVQLTAKNSKRIKALIGIARVFSAQEHYQRAESLYVELINNPRVEEAMTKQLSLNLYDTHFKAKKFDEAIEGFEKFAAANPTHERVGYAIYRIGSILAINKQHEAALERYQQVIEKFPKSDMAPNAYLGVGEQMIALGKHKEGVEYLSRYVKDNLQLPVAPNIFMKIAETYAEHLDNKNKAIEQYSYILENYSEPQQLLSYTAYKLGMLLNSQGDESGAKAVFEKVDPQDKNIYRASQAEIGKLIAKTNPQEAVQYYQRIVEASETPEDSATALIGIGDVYTTIKDWNSAQKKYKEVFDFYTGADSNMITGALVKRVDALLNGKMYNEAVQTAKIMQNRFPDHPLTINTFYFESAALLAMKQFARAREVMKKIIELNRSEQLSEIALYQLGDSYFFEQNLNGAIAAYGQYHSKYPSGKFAARALYMQGTCYISLPDPDFTRAKEKYSQVVTAHPDYDDICMARNYLAYCLNRLDDFNTALKYYNQVIGNGGCDKKSLDFAKEQREAIRASRL